MENALISDITINSNIARVSILNVENISGKAYEIFSALSNKSISVDIILQASLNSDKKNIIFTVFEDRLDETISTLKSHFSGIYEVEYTKNVAKVSVIGSGMINRPGVLAQVLETVESAFIDIQMISSSEMSISLIIDKNDAQKALKLLRNKLEMEQAVLWNF